MLPDLRIDLPALEPDPVLLEQLSQLSRASAPQRGQSRARSFVAGVTVVVVAGFSWLTGTLPGVASPFHREPAHHQPAPREDPVPTPDQGTTPSGVTVLPPTGSQGQGNEQGSGQGHTTPHQDNGLHLGQTKPHQDNGDGSGEDTGETTTPGDNGNHTGQTKPHHNNGHHTGQTQPHQNNGHHTGQTQPHQDSGQGQGNGHVK